jgi:hypothetical protein
MKRRARICYTEADIGREELNYSTLGYCVERTDFKDIFAKQSL